MMDEKLRADLASLLTASLRDQSVHRYAAMAEWRAAFTPRREGATDPWDAGIRMGPFPWGGSGLRDA